MSRLDGPVARGGAVLVFLGCVAALGYIHRDDLFPPEKQVSVADAAFDRCLRQRAGQIAQMLKDGLVDEARAALFRARAEAMCRDQTRRSQGGAGPALPEIR